MSPTIGPSATPGKLVDIGVAAHITAAAAGGPRYDASMTSDQRKAPANAIWLCQSCGKQVDSDASTHTVQTLQRWKQDAIALAARALALRDPDPDGRIKLAREQRHQLCSRALRSAVAARALVLQGVSLAKHLPEALAQGNDGLTNFTKLADEWYSRMKAAREALWNSILDVRVHWPEHSGHGLVELYVRTETWRNWFTENLLIVIGYKTRHTREHQERWSWDEVFSGNASHIELMNEQLTRDIEHVEAWASQHIAGREAGR